MTSGPYSELRVRKDYSYCNSRFWRPGIVLVGDAACFVDPVFSSGVHLASFYGMQASKQSNFWEAKKITNCPLSEFEAFVELVGGASSGEASLTRPETVAQRLVSSSRSLGNAADELDSRVGALHATDVVVSAMSESARVQEQVLEVCQRS